mgnify:CR=1 FL=1
MHSVRHFRSGGRANAWKVQKRTMDKKGKQQFLLVAFGVALYAALMNLNEVAAFLTRLATLFTPVIIGLLMAFVLSVPMQGIAGRLTRLMPKAKEKHIDLLSLLLTLLCVVIVVVLLCVLALPQLAASLKSIGTLVRENWPDWARLLSDHGVDTSELTDRIAALEPLIEKAMKDPEVIEKFNKIGLDAGYLPAKEFGQLIQSSSDLADEVLAGRKSLD